MATVAGIKIKTKQAKVRTTLAADEKFTGPEPQWNGDEEGTVYLRKIRQHLFYCNYHFTVKDLKKDVLQYCSQLGFTRDEIKELTSSYDGKRKVSTPTFAALCRAGNSGAPLTTEHKEKIATTFRQVISDYKELKSEPVEAEDGTATVAVPVKVTIQDRLSEKLSEYIAHFEGLYDEIIMGNTASPDSYSFLQANSVPQAQANKIARWFERHIAELTEAQAGKDPQLKEAYKHLKAKDYQRHLSFLKKIVEDCESYYQVKKTTRKVRAKKPTDKTKLVARLKYMQADPMLKLASINPVDILTASELWIYNARTRKLGRYVADEYSKTLSVKGTSITGFDEAKSVCKTLRKPSDQLKEFMKAGKVTARKFLDGVKAVEARMNGRINDETILLRVF